MTKHYLAVIILARLAKSTLLGFIVLSQIGIVHAASQTLAELVEDFQHRPATARQKILDYAKRQKDVRLRGVAYFALGYLEGERGRYQEAIHFLREAASRVPELADYAAAYEAKYWLEVGDEQSALKAAEKALRSEPSAVRPIAVSVAVKSLLKQNSVTAASDLLEQQARWVKEPQYSFLLALIHEKRGQTAIAAYYFQKVFYYYPFTDEARDAYTKLQSLKRQLGEKFPPPTAQELLARARVWFDGGDYNRAREEFSELIPLLSGRDREEARIWLAKSSYNAGRTLPAYRYLKGLQINDPDLDSERLYWISLCARRMQRYDEFLSLVELLVKKYPRSEWTMQALIAAGNYYLVRGDLDRANQFYVRCAGMFYDRPEAAYCHWKATWFDYLNRKPDVKQSLREHILRYPNSSELPTALYFLARLYEKEGKKGTALQYYQLLASRYSNYYYGWLARQALRERKPVELNRQLEDLLPIIEALGPATVTDWRNGQDGFKRALERSRLLRFAGLQTLAKRELLWQAEAGQPPHLVALELARQESNDGRHHAAIRAIKGLWPAYTVTPLEEAPEEVWQLAYPAPFLKAIVKEANRYGLDPHVLLGLIRQESEFNPRAVSPARAYGLAQILYSTGRSVARKIGIRRFRLTHLYEPVTNIRLGAYYLADLLKEFDGDIAAALAAYNAGKERVKQWKQWGNFQEPAEFIETIPFTETRRYVKLVLANAHVYRNLYQQQVSEILGQEREELAQAGSFGR